MRNQIMLHDEIESELKNLGSMDCCSEDYKVAVDGLTKLLDRAIEMEKLDISKEEAEANRYNELEKTMLQIEEEKKELKEEEKARKAAERASKKQKNNFK